MAFQVHPVTRERWGDFEKLFGERGACAGCWCMYWRQTRTQFEQRKGAGNRRAMKKIIDAGDVPGLLGYIDGEPVAWCSVAPRETFSSLGRSRILKPVDEKPVWSVVCFFVAREHRRKGLTVRMLDAAAEYARGKGATLIEGYPVEPKKPEMPEVFAFTGLASAFRSAGFEEVARRSDTRPILRRTL
jgi:GNAT superfamily N-acetyltransferase